MFIIVNSGKQITEPGNYSPSSSELLHWRQLGEKISNRFLYSKKPILLTPKDAMSDYVGNNVYPYLNGENFLQPIDNLINWVKTQTKPVVITLTQEAAHQLARDYWSETTYCEDIDIPLFGTNEAIIINFPYVTTVRV